MLDKHILQWKNRNKEIKKVCLVSCVQYFRFFNKTRAQFHNQGFILSVNPNNCWENFKRFVVLL